MARQRPSFESYDSDIRLLPISSPAVPKIFDRHRIARKPIANTTNSFYEAYHTVPPAPEVTWKAIDDVRTLRGWPSIPQRLGDRGPMSLLIVLTDIVLTLLPLVFIGEYAPLDYS